MRLPTNKILKSPGLFPFINDRKIVGVGSIRTVTGDLFESLSSAWLKIPQLKTDCRADCCPDLLDKTAKVAFVIW